MKIFSPRGQVVAILLYVLSEWRIERPKSRITHSIRSWKLFAFAEEDKTPYPSQEEKGQDAPRWETLVAFARLDCMENSWMTELGRDRWEISRTGLEVFNNLKQRCSEGAIDIRHGYLWTPAFKKILMPTFVPGDGDIMRPTGSIYDDTKFAAILDRFM